MQGLAEGGLPGSFRINIEKVKEQCAADDDECKVGYRVALELLKFGREIVGIEEEIDVMILSASPEEEKIALGIKQTQPNPSCVVRLSA